MKIRHESESAINRRQFLGRAAVAGGPLVYLMRGDRLIAAQAAADESPQRAAALATGMIIREKEPVNLEMPFNTLDSWITPNERFFVRSHFKIPKIEARAWRLKVEGGVARPLELTYEELTEMESQTIPALLECSGNNRVFLMPKEKGVSWQLGAVGNAEWTGVPLKAVIERAKLKESAVELIFEGQDAGEMPEPPRPSGKFHFARSIPKEKALDDVLLAWKMNGRELPQAHGFPVRAIVPGWYGMASVKWLHRIIATDTPYRGHFQTIEYAIYERPEGEPPRREQITELQAKAQIARPDFDEIVPASSKYRIHGAAWTSDAEIAKVEISHDWGATWDAAKVLGKSVKNAWQFWEYEWQTPTKPGKYTLMARATDSRGRTQPDKRDPDLGNAMIHHLLPIEVEVR